MKRVSIKQFIEFKRLRNLYEKRVLEKARHLKEDIIPTSLRALIEDDDLIICIAAGWINATSLEKITEKQIEECVDERCNRETTGEQLCMENQAVRNVSMNLNIVE